MNYTYVYTYTHTQKRHKHTYSYHERGNNRHQPRDQVARPERHRELSSTCVLQCECVTMCCSVSRCANMYKHVCCSVKICVLCCAPRAALWAIERMCVAECCRVLQSVAVCCGVSICVDMRQHVCCRVTDSTFVLFARLERHCALSSACVLQFVPMCCIVSRCVKIDVAV